MSSGDDPVAPAARTIGAGEAREPCGCVSDAASGLPLRTCEQHDRRAPWLKASAALAQMAAHLDTAGRLLENTARGLEPHAAGEHLRAAALAALKASKALASE